jgi:hypothetical protein
MPYIVETWYKLDRDDDRRQCHSARRQFLDHNSDKHLLLASGAKLQDDGSDANGNFMIFAVESREEVERLMADDPFTAAGLFDRVVITRWRKSYLDGRCYL